jgi:predicted RNase H-like HicB family nuclease
MSSIKSHRVNTEVVYINLPGPQEPIPRMTGAELLHGFLVDLYNTTNPEIRMYLNHLTKKWNIQYRGSISHKYLVVYEKAKSNYSAYLPDLPGCIATGKTRKETEKNIKEAIKLHIDGLKEDGMQLPESASFTEYVEVK